MNIITLPLGPLETNCYLVCEDGVCAVIDPGASAQKNFCRDAGRRLPPGGDPADARAL